MRVSPVSSHSSGTWQTKSVWVHSAKANGGIHTLSPFNSMVKLYSTLPLWPTTHAKGPPTWCRLGSCTRSSLLSPYPNSLLRRLFFLTSASEGMSRPPLGVSGRLLLSRLGELLREFGLELVRGGGGSSGSKAADAESTCWMVTGVVLTDGSCGEDAGAG